MIHRKPLPTYSSAFESEIELSDGVSPGARPLLPSMDSFQVFEPSQSKHIKATKFFWSAQRLAAETWQDVKRDVGSARWGRGGLWFLFFLWAAGLLVALVLVPLFAASSSKSACKPDGSFSVLNQYDAWNIDDFFQITVTVFGQLNFTEAKLIDVVWDVVLGRVGQVVLVLFSWKAFALHIMSEMEDDDGLVVTYDTYWTFFMAREAGLVNVSVLIRDFYTRKGLRSRLTMIVVVLTMLFVMGWPTIAGAMTGYDSNNTGFVNLTDNTQVPFSAFQPVLYVIHDGSRVNLTDNYYVPYCNGTYDGDPVALSTEYTDYSYCSTREGDYSYYSEMVGFITRGLQRNVTEYVSQYGFYGLNNTESNWTYTNVTLAAPALNISAFYIDQTSEYEFSWSTSSLLPFTNWSNMAYMYDNKTYDLTYIQSGNGLCQPSGTYKWGFSFLQVFIALCLMATWTMAIWAVWLRAHVRLSSRGPYEFPTQYQGAMVLSNSIEEEFTEHDKPMAMSNEDFTNYRSKILRGGSVRNFSTRSLVPGAKVGVWSSIKRWLRKERWWCIALLVETVWVSTGWMACTGLLNPFYNSYYGGSFRDFSSLDGFYLLSLWAWPSMVFAMAIGTTRKSRLFFIGCWEVLGLVIIMSLFNS